MVVSGRWRSCWWLTAGDGSAEGVPVGVGVPAGELVPLEPLQRSDDGRPPRPEASGPDAELASKVVDVDVDALGVVLQEGVEPAGGERGSGAGGSGSRRAPRKGCCSGKPRCSVGSSQGTTRSGLGSGPWASGGVGGSSTPTFLRGGPSRLD